MPYSPVGISLGVVGLQHFMYLFFMPNISWVKKSSMYKIMLCFALNCCSRTCVCRQKKERVSPIVLWRFFLRIASAVDAQEGSYASICFGKQITFEFMLFLTYVPSSRYQEIAVVVMIQYLSRCLSACFPLIKIPIFNFVALKPSSERFWGLAQNTHVIFDTKPLHSHSPG